jgi:hypothetical protein
MVLLNKKRVLLRDLPSTFPSVPAPTSASSSALPPPPPLLSHPNGLAPPSEPNGLSTSGDGPSESSVDPDVLYLPQTGEIFQDYECVTSSLTLPLNEPRRSLTFILIIQPPPTSSLAYALWPSFLPSFLRRLPFSPHRSYASRVNFYRQKRFTCEVTHRANLTYFQALESERREAQTLHTRFPEPLKVPVLASVQFRSFRPPLRYLSCSVQLLSFGGNKSKLILSYLCLLPSSPLSLASSLCLLPSLSVHLLPSLFTRSLPLSCLQSS